MGKVGGWGRGMDKCPAQHGPQNGLQVHGRFKRYFHFLAKPEDGKLVPETPFFLAVEGPAVALGADQVVQGVHHLGGAREAEGAFAACSLPKDSKAFWLKETSWHFWPRTTTSLGKMRKTGPKVPQRAQ